MDLAGASEVIGAGDLLEISTGRFRAAPGWCGSTRSQQNEPSHRTHTRDPPTQRANELSADRQRCPCLYVPRGQHPRRVASIDAPMQNAGRARLRKRNVRRQSLARGTVESRSGSRGATRRRRKRGAKGKCACRLWNCVGDIAARLTKGHARFHMLNSKVCVVFIRFYSVLIPQPGISGGGSSRRSCKRAAG